MLINIICEKPKEKKNLDKLVEIFKEIKKKHSVEINLKIANNLVAVNSLKNYRVQNDEILFVFGASLYKKFLVDINEFYKEDRKEVHKFSYFIKSSGIHYFIAFMPPLDFTMAKPETFMAFESCLESLKRATRSFQAGPEEVYTSKSKNIHKNPKVDIVENGFSPKVNMAMKFSEVMQVIDELFALPDYYPVAIDFETAGLQIWDKTKHHIYIASFSWEDGYGHAINLGLPGVMHDIKGDNLIAVLSRLEKYIFDKKKTFTAWKCDFDIFGVCNFFGRSFEDFLENNIIKDAMQMLHIISENRQIEGYNLKSVSRDFLNYSQYAYVKQYIRYIENWQTMTSDECLDCALKSLKYAAEDAAAEHSLFLKINREIQADEISVKHYKKVSHIVQLDKLFIQWTGWKVAPYEEMAKGLMSLQAWEIDDIVRPTMKMSTESADGRVHPEIFVFATKTGRLQYAEPQLNKMKMGSPTSKYFLSDSEKHSLVHVDMSQAEVAVAALLCQDYHLIDDLNDNPDYYRHFAKTIFKKEDIDDEEREIAKQITISMIYLASKTTLAKKLNSSEQDAQKYIDLFYERYPKMEEMKVKVGEFLKANQMIFGASFRKRRYSEDDMSSDNYWRSFLSAHNMPIQSTSSDMMLLNMIEFINRTKKEYGVNVVNTCHDSATFNVPDKHMKDVCDEIEVAFTRIPGIILEGVNTFNEQVLGKSPAVGMAVKTPNIRYKIYAGKNFHDMKEVVHANL